MIRSDQSPLFRSKTIAKNQNTFAKRQREMEKKRKQEDKRRRRTERKASPPPVDDSPFDADAADDSDGIDASAELEDDLPI